MLADTVVSLLYAVLKNCASIILETLQKILGTLLKNYANLLWNSLFISGWPETRIELLLLPAVSSMTLQKKPAIHQLLCHLLN